MKYHREIVIDAPRERVWRLFDDPGNLSKWQPTLRSFEPRSGKPGEVGAVSELVYEENGRRVVMTETITERREPDFLAGVYESDWGATLIVNHFEVQGEQRTKWSVWCNFRFRGFMRLLSPFMAGSIRRRTDADLERFKALAESADAAS